MSGYDSVNRNVSSRVQKVARDGADVNSGACRQFHTWGPVNENARLPTVERWTRGWTRQSLQDEWSPRLLGRSATEVNGPRYDGAQPWSTLYTRTATLDLMRSGTRSQLRLMGETRTCWPWVLCSNHFAMKPHDISWVPFKQPHLFYPWRKHKSCLPDRTWRAGGCRSSELQARQHRTASRSVHTAKQSSQPHLHRQEH